MTETLEKIVTKKCNPMVHRLNSQSIHLPQEESIKDFGVRLRSSAPDCEFQCPICHFELQSINIKDQIIRGLQNESIQTDILAKASQLKTLEGIIKHSEAFETAQCDQIQLQGSSEVMIEHMSDYQKKKNEPNLPKPILHAVDEYHVIELDAESQPLTMFITEWGHYIYFHLPQEYLAAGDAYTRQNSIVISEETFKFCRL